MAIKKKATKAKKSAKSTNKKKTYIALVIDRSGSMMNLHKQTVDGINEQFNVYRRDGDGGGDTHISLIQFDDQIDTVFDGLAPSELVNWEDKDFQPRGSTAMYDGVWAAINNLKAKEETDDTGYLICVISDGYENASKEITQETLSKEIKRLQETGKWTFSYMLANQDIHQVSAALNVPVSNFVAYAGSSVGASATWTANSTSTSDYFSARNAGNLSSTAFFSDKQRDEVAKAK